MEEVWWVLEVWWVAVEDIHKIDPFLGGIHMASLDDEDVHQTLMVMMPLV